MVGSQDPRIPFIRDPTGSDGSQRSEGSDLRSGFFGSGSRIRIIRKNIPDLGSTDPDLNLNFLGSGSRIRIFYFFLILNHGSHSDLRTGDFSADLGSERILGSGNHWRVDDATPYSNKKDVNQYIFSWLIMARSIPCWKQTFSILPSTGVLSFEFWPTFLLNLI